MLKKTSLFLVLAIFLFQAVCLAGSFSPDDFRYSVLRSSSVTNYLHMEFRLSDKNTKYTLQVNPENKRELFLTISDTKLKHNNLKQTTLDGEFADKISFKDDGANIKAVISLPYDADQADYKAYMADNNKSKSGNNVLAVDISKKEVQKSVSPSLQAVAGHVIVIDPGHGGSDSGAVGPDGIMEKNVTLAVAQKVYNILVNNGATVIMTRTTDRDVYAPDASAVDELQARVNVGEFTRGTDIFLSIHANSFSSPSANGTGTYYYQYSPQGERLASLMQEEMINANGLTDRGTAAANFYVLKHTSMPSALIELAFISNYQEEQLLNSDDFQEMMAEAICRGISRYFQGS